MQLRNYPSAIALFKQALKVDPNCLDAIYNRAVCFMHLGTHKLAIPDFLEVAKQYPTYDKQLYIALAMCFAATNDLSAAVS